jgi:hypothetical protein
MDMQETTPRERKPYAKPQLVEYGDLEALTESFGASGSDMIIGSNLG